MPKRFKKVYIEISNVCNLQCTFCPPVVRDTKFMDPELFDRVLQEVAPLTEEVCFHLMGEPLLHPEFESYLKRCQSAGVRVNLTTNGILLDDRRQEALFNPTLSQINFSLQSFEANFPGQEDSDYLQRIFNFTERALIHRPELYINFRLWNVGVSGAEQSNARMMAKISARLQVQVTPMTDIRWRKGVHLKGRVYLHFDSRFEWPNPHRPVRSTRGFCHGLSSHIGILADGTVVPCCLDKEGVINLGNCGSQRIADIVETPRAQRLQQGFRAGQLLEDLCQKCTFIARFDHRLKQQIKPSDRDATMPVPQSRG